MRAILGGDDHSLIASETGNGKTLCFLIPMIQSILRCKEAHQNR
jgi:superfamily II DNA/RNA helicase